MTKDEIYKRLDRFMDSFWIKKYAINDREIYKAIDMDDIESIKDQLAQCIELFHEILNEE